MRENGEAGELRHSGEREQERHDAPGGAGQDGFAVLDFEGRIRRVNAAQCRMLGVAEAELVGQKADWLDGGEAGAGLERRLLEARREGSARFETRMKRKDGTLVEVEVSVAALQGEREVLVFVRDISRHKRLEGEREDMLRLLRLLNQPGGMSELTEGLARFLQGSSGCEAVRVWLRDEEGFPEPVNAGSFWTNDLESPEAKASELPQTLKERWAAKGYRSFALVPLRFGGKMSGLLQLADRARGRLSEGQMAFLARAAESIAAALEQRAAQEALRRSEERFRAIAEYTLEWENWFDGEGRLLWVNPGVERITGYTAEECLRMEGFPLPVIDVEDRDRVRATFALALDGASGVDQEIRIRRKNGEVVWCSVSWTPIYDTAGRAMGHRSSLRDISARKREQQVLESRLNLTEYARTHTLAELLEETINEAEKLTGSGIGFYHFLDGDEQSVLLQAWSTRTRSEMCRIAQEGEHYSIDRAGVWVDCVRQRRVVIHNDYAALEHRKGLPEGHAEVKRELVAPAFRGQRIVALLGVGNKAGEYDERDAEVVRQLADLAWDIVEWKRAEEALKASESNYRGLVEQLPLGTIVEREGRVAYLNAEAARILGLSSKASALGKELARFAGRLNGNGTVREGKWRRADGRAIDVEWATARVQYEGRESVHLVFRDITRTKVLEQQFIQAQKMESLGRLAGGVAHDFNNLLTVINGYCQLLLGGKKAVQDSRAAIEQIQRAGERAERLVGQMLAFSRKQMLNQETLNPCEVISGVEKMLARLLGEDIELRAELKSGEAQVKADRTQLEQVILNLAVNARDAMPEGGALTISTEPVTVAEKECPVCGGTVAPGRYVRIGVSDTGVGMDAGTLSHLFEPFFTTKGPGKGTGLGLAMVHGTVMQAGGHLDVKSEPGCGTRFDIYLPEEEVRGAAAERAGEDGDHAGTERILLVEDQAGVRDYAAEVLSAYGYQVRVASDPAEALEAAPGGQFDLLVTDVVMPRMSGAEMARRLRKERPGLKVLFVSGYPGDELAHAPGDGDGERFLAKPFSPQALGRAVRELLDGA